MNDRTKAGGFTLIELMVVIAVISLLMTLLVPVVSQATRMIQKGQVEQMLHDISVGLEAFYADFHCYPPSKPHDDSDPDSGGLESGAANLAIYLRGPVGRGWGTTAGGLMPLGGRAQRAYGPYYSVEESLVAYDADEVLAGFLDPLQPAGRNADEKIVGRILYFRKPPNGTIAWDDNPDDPGETDPTKQAFEGYVSEKQAALIGVERYLLVSPGFDRRYGLLYESDDGIVPDVDGDEPGRLTPDDIQYAR